MLLFTLCCFGVEERKEGVEESDVVFEENCALRDGCRGGHEPSQLQLQLQYWSRVELELGFRNRSYHKLDYLMSSGAGAGISVAPFWV